MILRGRVQKKVSHAGVWIKLENRGGIHLSHALAARLGLAFILPPAGSYEYEGIEQDVEIEVRRVDR